MSHTNFFSSTHTNFFHPKAPKKAPKKSLCGYVFFLVVGGPGQSAQSPGLLGAAFFDGQDIHAQGSGVPRGAPEARGGPMVLHGAPTALEADALSTALFVLGPEQAKEMVESMDLVDALFISKSGNMTATDGFSLI